MIVQLKTIPDIHAGRRLYGNAEEMQHLSVKDVARVMHLHHDQQHPQHNNRLAAHLEKIVCISLIDTDACRIYHWHSSPDKSDAELLAQFAEKANDADQLCTWKADKLQSVLYYRALLQHCPLELPQWRSLDAHLVNQAHDPLTPAHELAHLLDLPHCKTWTDEAIWQAYLREDMDAINHACISEAKMFAGLLSHWQYVQGEIDKAQYQAVLKACI